WRYALSTPEQFEQVRAEVITMWEETEDGQYLVNTTLAEEHEKALDRVGALSEGRAEAGRRGAALTWRSGQKKGVNGKNGKTQANGWQESGKDMASTALPTNQPTDPPTARVTLARGVSLRDRLPAVCSKILGITVLKRDWPKVSGDYETL